MDTYLEKVNNFKKAVYEALDRLNISGLEDDLKLLNAETKTANFWQDNLKAQKTMRRISEIEKMISPWIKLRAEVSEIEEWVKNDDAESVEVLITLLNKTEKEFKSLKKQLRFSGQYDGYDSIVSIYSGAGGTDAQDWAQILLRMYLRYAEKKGFKTNIIDQSLGDTAGIKSVTFEVDGPYSYGLLKNEQGVHRLVRLSPFNADSLRQTSFAKVEILPKIDEPDEIVIDDKDLRVDVFRSGGKGGQSVNTTDSAVRITHLPTGMVVSIQNERSQLQNRELALTVLRSKLAQLQIEQHQSDLDKIKGPNLSAEWGNQIRSYVMHPYKQVKDLRSKYETGDVDSILNGDLDKMIEFNLEHIML